MELTKISHNIVPSQKDIDDLRDKIEDEKRKSEYEKLKQDLIDISLNAKYDINEFDSGLKKVDTERVLTSQRKTNHFSDILIQNFLKMASPRPVARNIFALAVLFGCVFCVITFLHIKQFEPYKIHFCYFLESAAAIQILKSASRSLFIPLAALLIGIVTSTTMQNNQMLLQHHQLFYQALMIVGILGLTISVFTID